MSRADLLRQPGGHLTRRRSAGSLPCRFRLGFCAEGARLVHASWLCFRLDPRYDLVRRLYVVSAIHRRPSTTPIPLRLGAHLTQCYELHTVARLVVRVVTLTTHNLLFKSLARAPHVVVS